MTRRAALWLVLSALFAVKAAYAAPIRVEWDPSSDPGVVGYRVYVGTESSRYTETYDVGPQTAFEYPGAAGQTYYFAVAAYLPGGRLSSLSNEVLGYAKSEPLVASVYPQSPLADNPRGSTVCSASTNRSCFEAKEILGELGAVSSLALLPDGRLLIVEDGRRVRVAIEGQLLKESALEVQPPERLTQAVVDPLFVRSRFLFVGVVETRADGRRELNIVRYREVNNQLAEAAVIVPGLPLNASDDAPFAVDNEGHLYVALPGTGDSVSSGRALQAGAVVRFNTDGSVPGENRNGSPIVAYGFASPVALAWDASGQRLWLSGSDPEMRSPIALLSLKSDAEWPAAPRPVLVSTPASLPRESRALFSIARSTTPGGLMLLFPDPVGGRPGSSPDQAAPPFERLALDELGLPVAVTAGPNGRTYIALQQSSVAGQRRFAVVALQSQ